MFNSINFEKLYKTPGFSDDLLNTHFGLYQGYVANTNKLMDIMKLHLESDKMSSVEFAEIKRRFGWEFNGMRLHELYFENINREENELDASSHLFRRITTDFGSFGKWEDEFKSTGAIRGIGWVVLYYDPVSSRLFNVWINEHDAGHLAGLIPIIVMDVFEHAYMKDYGADRKAYINAFVNSIDWSVAEKRYTNALKQG